MQVKLVNAGPKKALYHYWKLKFRIVILTDHNLTESPIKYKGKD